jgi:hypothetical protein
LSSFTTKPVTIGAIHSAAWIRREKLKGMALDSSRKKTSRTKRGFTLKTIFG